MRRFLLSMSLLLFGWILSGQEDREAHQVAVFVYCNGTINTPTNALRARLTSSIMNDSSGSFVVLDRSDEILSLLKKEFKYQGDGYVRDDQLVSIGEHLGVFYLCVVIITPYPDNQFFFECQLVNVAARQLEKQSYYPGEGASVSSLSIQEQIRVAGELAKAFYLKKNELKVGDVYYDENNSPVYVDGGLMRIGFVDQTGKHGFAFVVLPMEYNSPHLAKSDIGLEIPSISQLRLLYVNREILGLNAEYWSIEDAGDPKYYKSLNFRDEIVRSRRSSSIVFRDGSTWAIASSRRETEQAFSLSCINILLF